MSPTRAEKVARAQELRGQGLLVREVAERMGVAGNTVSAWLNDPERTRNRRLGLRGAQKRRADENLRHPCANCSRLICRNSHLCLSCEIGRKQERRRELQRRWLAGESIAQIAAALDTSPGAIRAAIACMRRDGWDMPYRYNVQAKRAA